MWGESIESGLPILPPGAPRESRKIMKLLDRIPLDMLAVAALALGLAPFTPEPHLWEKLKMLAAGTLVRPIDIFDLFLHGTPVLLLGAKLARIGWIKAHPETQS